MNGPINAIARTRATVDTFVLPPTPLVPQGHSVVSDISPEQLATLRSFAQTLSEGLDQTKPYAPSDLARWRRLCLQALATLDLPEPDQALLQPRNPLIDEAPHDAYFLLARQAQSPALGYLGALIAALSLLLDEVHDAGELADYASIPQALVDLWLGALAAPARPCTQQPHSTLAFAAMQHRAPDAVRRWLRGHQLFAVLTQGLVWALNSLNHAFAQGSVEATRAAMVRVAGLYLASASTFRFTADFDPLYYTQTIRPSMCEPYVPAGFSGTLSVDHAHMIRLLSSMGLVLRDAQAHWPDLHANMQQALSRLYQDHKWVCERFDGAASPSLRTGSHQGSTQATEMLERFHQRRLQMLT